MPPDDDALTATSPGGLGSERRSSAAPAFGSGEILADRFRIVSLLGRGGMGEVYEADDLALGERVALKAIRAESAREESTRERFRREIQLARKVTHVNVCRTFELVRHTTAAGDGLALVSMELLRGETLAEHLKRAGRFTPEEALPLIEQLVAALAAAHDAGVVHRDFKCSNVLLVPRPHPQPPRAVVTDFGLAQSSEPDGSSVTATGMVMGTPDYMAPEQVQGKETSPATDIYALGLVLYEMLTGRLPFAAETPMSGAVKRLQENPAPPRTLEPSLAPSWDQTILRCLQREPGDRFARVEHVLPALKGETDARARGARRPWVSVVVALVVLLAAAASWWISRGPPPAGPHVNVRRSVALVGFKNLSGRPDAAWLSGALAEMLGTELEAGEQMRVVPGEDVARMKQALGLAEAESFSKDTLSRIRRRLNADLVVVGSYVAIGEGQDRQVRVDLRVQDAATGETIAPVAAVGTEGALFDLVSQAAADLRRQLRLDELSAPQRAQVAATLPSDAAAVRWYAEGLERWRAFDRGAARLAFEKALAVDPQFALAHSALAELLRELQYNDPAMAHARRASALAEKLPREERLLVEARAFSVQGEAPKAGAIYRTLHEFFPDNVEYGLEYARLLPAVSTSKDEARRREMDALIASLRRLPPPQGDDPRIDLAQARGEDWDGPGAARALVALENARRKARERNTPHVEAWAAAEEYLVHGFATRDPEKANAAFADAKRLLASTGDRLGLAVLLHQRGEELLMAWRVDAAEEAIQRAIAIYREAGHSEALRHMTTNLARTVRRRGDLVRARRLYEEVVQVEPSAHNHQFLGWVCFGLGDVETARREHARALRACATTTPTCGGCGTFADCRPYVGLTLSMMKYELGDVAGALATVEASAKALAGGSNLTDDAWAAGIRGDLLVARDDFAEARRAYERAIELTLTTGERGSLADRRRSLAELELEEGRFAEAETLARAAAGSFRTERIVDRGARAEAILALALVARGKNDDARRVEAEVRRAQPQVQDQVVRIALAVHLARLDAAQGRTAAAREALQSAIGDAEALGFVASAMAARLALAEIDGAAVAAPLARDARARGFALVARKASALATP